MADTIFTNQTPVVTNADDDSQIQTATVFVVAQARQILRLRWYAPMSNIGTVTGRVYFTAGEILIDDTTFTGVVAGQWNESADFAPPIDIDETQAYTASIHNTGDGYVATSGAFSSGGITNGDLTAIQHGSSPFGAALNNGVYAYGAVAYPGSNGGGVNFFADVVLVPLETAVDVTDAAALTDSAILAATIVSADAATTAEAATIAVDASGSDSATTTEAAAVAAGVAATDAGALDEASALAAAIDAVDGSLLTEAALAAAALAGTDSGALTESATVDTGGYVPPGRGAVTLHDSAAVNLVNGPGVTLR